MKEKLDLFISLLDKAIKSDNIKDLAIIEEDLQKLSSDLNKDLLSDDNILKNEEIMEKLGNLEVLIKQLDSSKNFNSQLFQEFKLFLDNRKFK
tara:strand:- start:33 stop:311 length:279 start_codon:yes stop_codon:yes gene_type:complete